MKGEYDNSVAETEEARVVFEAELEKKIIGGGKTPVTIAKAVLDYVGAMKLVYKGLKFIVGKIVQNQLEEALQGPTGYVGGQYGEPGTGRGRNRPPHESVR